jgi:membrane associated rhomboid family serine protease
MATFSLKNPLPYDQYNAAVWLIFANIAVFFLQNMSPRLTAYLAMTPYYVLNRGAFWQLVTYMFAHGSINHIIFNMLGLYFFGTQIEKRMGSSEFILFYLVCGAGAGLFSLGFYWLSGSYAVYLLGASGAVFAVLLAFAAFFPYASIYVFGLIPVKAPVLVIAYTLIELFSQVSGSSSGVAHFTHLAGFGTAFVYLLFRFRINAVKVFFKENDRWH